MTTQPTIAPIHRDKIGGNVFVMHHFESLIASHYKCSTGTLTVEGRGSGRKGVVVLSGHWRGRLGQAAPSQARCPEVVTHPAVQSSSWLMFLTPRPRPRRTCTCCRSPPPHPPIASSFAPLPPCLRAADIRLCPGDAEQHSSMAIK